MLLSNGKWVNNYIPEELPCGKAVNKVYNAKRLQCCRTECADKSNNEIEQCYKGNKLRTWQ